MATDALDANSVLFLDTAPLIYLFEEHAKFHAPVRELLDEVYAVGAQMLTSMVTYIELTTRPRQMGNDRLVARYRDLLTHTRNLRLVPLDLNIADEAANLRARYRLKTPDAIQLATAITHGASRIITNDRQWSKIQSLDIIQVSDLVKA